MELNSQQANKYFWGQFLSRIANNEEKRNQYQFDKYLPVDFFKTNKRLIDDDTLI